MATRQQLLPLPPNLGSTYYVPLCTQWRWWCAVAVVGQGYKQNSLLNRELCHALYSLQLTQLQPPQPLEAAYDCAAERRQPVKVPGQGS
jgi:hypothetical protein